MKKEAVKKMQFKFKYFPENVADEVIQDSTMKMLYRQVREHKLKEKKVLPGAQEKLSALPPPPHSGAKLNIYACALKILTKRIFKF